MPPDQSAQPPGMAAQRGGSPEPSRRSVLRGAAGLGAAGVASAAAATALTTAGTQALAAATIGKPETRKSDFGQSDLGDSEIRDSGGGDVVAHVRDVRGGVIDVYRGTAHSQVHDVDLADRIARASSSGVSADEVR